MTVLQPTEFLMSVLYETYFPKLLPICTCHHSKVFINIRLCQKSLN